jgi:uncharacterized membrane protein
LAALVSGTIAAYASAPAKWRTQVTSVFFGLIIIGVTVVLIHAILTHTVQNIHWFWLLWVCVAWFLNRKLFRQQSEASSSMELS